MPWKVCDLLKARSELVRLLVVEGANVSALCRSYGVSRRVAYKWLARYREHGEAGLVDQPRRPKSSPNQTVAEVEQRVLQCRDAHPAWGGRKLRESLRREGGAAALPAASTITGILRRGERLQASESVKHQAFIRFEHPAPNDLWQMDFKGHVGLTGGGRCHPLTILDDHSRFAIGLQACENERASTVRERLENVFRRYGLPRRMLMDNGPPWGGDLDSPHTVLTVWMLRLGIGISHGRPYHPQTQGKDERFHRTLNAEVFSRQQFVDLVACQARFDPWRDEYNLHRPHEALNMASPVTRYTPSSRSFPETLPALEISPGDLVRKVQDGGWFSFQGQSYHLSKAFYREQISLRPTLTEGLWTVLYGQHPLGQLDQRDVCQDRYKIRTSKVRD